MGTMNLFPNPSFENTGSAIQGWDIQANDFTVSNTGGSSRPHCISQVSAGAYENFNTHNDQPSGIPVLPSTTYTVSFFAKVTVSAGSPAVYVMNKTDAFTDSVFANVNMNDNGGVYTRFSTTFTTDSSTTKLWFRIFNNNGTVTAFYDAFQLELGTLTAYMDGTVAGCRWLGTIDNSISTRLPAVYGNHVRHAFARVV